MIIKHTWQPSGFNRFTCIKCLAVKRFDYTTERIVYDKGNRVNMYRAPECVSVINCDPVKYDKSHSFLKNQ